MENNWIDDRLTVLTPDPAWHPDVNQALVQLRERLHVRRRSGRTWTWSVAAVTASLCLLAFPSPRAAAQYCLSCSVALWQNLATAKVAHISLKPEGVRKLAPNFTLIDASGRPVELSKLNGQVVLLNFWATWCGGCKVEIPWFIDFQRHYQGRLTVLGVAFDDDGWKLVRPYIATKRVNYPVMLGDSRIAGLYGVVAALPVTYVIDKTGRIAATHLGVVSRVDYQAEIEKLLHE